MGVENRQRLADTHAKLLATARAAMEDRRRGPRIDRFPFAGHDVFVLNARDDDLPLAPSWCLTEDALVIAPFTQNIKAYLSRDEEPGESILAVGAVARLVQPKSGPTVLAYVDTKSVFEQTYPFALTVVQAVLGELSEDIEIDANVWIFPSIKAKEVVLPTTSRSWANSAVMVIPYAATCGMRIVATGATGGSQRTRRSTRNVT